MRYFDLLTFIQYFFFTTVSLFYFGLVGFFSLKRILLKLPASLIAAISIFSGIAGFIFFVNLLSYIVLPNLAIKIVFTFFTILFLTQLSIVVSHIQNVKIQKIKFPARSLTFFILLLLFYIIAFVNGLYDIFIFDEEFHRPLISSIIMNNFPIYARANPFELSPHFNYHYGIDLLGASFVLITKIPSYVALDVISSISLFGTFLLFYGLFRKLHFPQIRAFFITAAGIMSGGFAYLLVPNTERAVFFQNNFMPFMFSGFVPLFHALYTSTFIYIPMSIAFALLFLYAICHSTAVSFQKRAWTLVPLLSIILAGATLVNETIFLLIFISLCVALIFRFAIYKNQRSKIYNEIILFLLLYIITSVIVIFQGGFISGFFLREYIQSAFGYSEIMERFGMTSVTAIHNADIDQFPFFFKILKPANNILLPTNINLFMSELGLYGILAIAVSVAIGKKILSSSTAHREELLILFSLFVINFLIPTFLSSPLISDSYFAKFSVISMAIFPFLLFYILFTTPLSAKMKTFLLILIIFSTLPNFFFKTYQIFYNNNIENNATYSPARYSMIDYNTLSEFPGGKNRPIFFSNLEDGFMITDIVGALTYEDVLSANPSLFHRMTNYLSSKDLEVLHIDYIYLTPSLYEQFSPLAKKNLAKNFSVIIEKSDGEEWRQILERHL